jgi:ABC-type glutathione transport system ATPase component
MKSEHGWVQILRGISLELRENQSLGIVGPSGAGKSMTVNALCGLLPRSGSRMEGEITFRGGGSVTEMDSVKRHRICSSNIALIPQDSISALNPYQRLGTQLRETFALHRPGFRDEDIFEALSEIGLDAGSSLLYKFPHQISGGMRQRIAIAMAISSKARILIADEPATSLDAVNETRFLRLIGKLRAKRGLSLIFISHNLAAVSTLCDDVLIMRGGSVVKRGNAKDMLSASGLSRPRTPPHACKRAETPMAEPERPILRVENLSKSFVHMSGLWLRKSVTRAVDGMSFSVRRKETLGISGESGCGKSTLAKMIVRLIKPDGGDISFEGRDILTLSAGRFRKIRPSLQMISQNPFDSLDPSMRISDLLTEGLREHGGPSGRKKQLELLKPLLEECGLSPSCLDRYPGSFSGGELQRLNIARALAL